MTGTGAQELAASRAPGFLGSSSRFLCRHRGTTEGSAVCVFTMRDVQNAFSGLYKEVNRETQQWYTVTHPVPSPRPGAVSTGRLWLLWVSFLLLKEGLKPRAAYLTGLDVAMDAGVPVTCLGGQLCTCPGTEGCAFVLVPSLVPSLLLSCGFLI